MEKAEDTVADLHSLQESLAQERVVEGVNCKGRSYTVSIALPGSIVSNAQTLELKTYLAGQIARAACVFNVDEVVIFNEQPPAKGNVQKSDPNIFLARILQYLETPQYLRKVIFPKHKDLQLVGLLNPLDCPHHMRIDDEFKYREGVVLNRPPKTKGKGGSYVNAGMRKDVQIDKTLVPGVRVTIELQSTEKSGGKNKKGVVVSPSTPRTQDGYYWGYQTRYASSFGSVFRDCPFKGGYNLTIGTSERGSSVDEIKGLKSFNHLLVVFGGLQGLEASLESDETLEEEEVSQLFHLYVNTCPQQGSRTIRTEEAILITMATLRPLIVKAGIL